MDKSKLVTGVVYQWAGIAAASNPGERKTEDVEFRYMGGEGHAIVCEPGDSGGGMQSCWGVDPEALEPKHILSEVMGRPMKLWLLTRTDETDYDEYDSAVVSAETEYDAARVHVKGAGDHWGCQQWAPSPDQIKVVFLGDAAPEIKSRTVIHSSYRAG